MDLDRIWQDKTVGFPTGVSEEIFVTEGEVRAFVKGVGFANDIDVETGEPFQRGTEWVVRVQVGDFGDDDLDDDEDF